MQLANATEEEGRRRRRRRGRRSEVRAASESWPRAISGRLSSSSQRFLSQFCDVAKVAINHRRI